MKCRKCGFHIKGKKHEEGEHHQKGELGRTDPQKIAKIRDSLK